MRKARCIKMAPSMVALYQKGALRTVDLGDSTAKPGDILTIKASDGQSYKTMITSVREERHVIAKIDKIKE